MIEKLKDALNGEKPIRVLLFSKPLKEYGEIMMIVKFGEIHIVNPFKSASRPRVFNNNRKVSPVVVSSEF